MMISTVKSQSFSKPCIRECRYNGPIEPDDSLCMVCGMTPLEKDQWPLLSDSERIERGLEVGHRVEMIWLMWELTESPTLQ